jgi:hypothetical protein
MFLLKEVVILKKIIFSFLIILIKPMLELFMIKCSYCSLFQRLLWIVFLNQWFVNFVIFNVYKWNNYKYINISDVFKVIIMLHFLHDGALSEKLSDEGQYNILITHTFLVSHHLPGYFNRLFYSKNFCLLIVKLYNYCKIQPNIPIEEVKMVWKFDTVKPRYLEVARVQKKKNSTYRNFELPREFKT